MLSTNTYQSHPNVRRCRAQPSLNHAEQLSGAAAIAHSHGMCMYVAGSLRWPRGSRRSPTSASTGVFLKSSGQLKLQQSDITMRSQSELQVRWKCAGAEAKPAKHARLWVTGKPRPQQRSQPEGSGPSQPPVRPEKIALGLQRKRSRSSPFDALELDWLVCLPLRGNGRGGGARGCWAGRAGLAAGGRRRLRKVRVAWASEALGRAPVPENDLGPASGQADPWGPPERSSLGRVRANWKSQC